MLLSAPFAPTLPHNPHLTVRVPKGSEAEQSDRGCLRSSEEERESDCAERQIFLESRGGGTGREESSLGTARSPLDY